METCRLVSFILRAISSPFSTALTKSPRGVHKHFRIIALSQYLQSHGYTPLEYEHTRIPRIWKKLESLYNLEALDDRVSSLSMYLVIHTNSAATGECFQPRKFTRYRGK